MWESNSCSTEHCTLLEQFRNKKNEYQVGAVWCLFINSTIMNKNKQDVSHSKQETISIILHIPLPQSLCSPKQSLTNLTEPEVPKIIVVTGQKAVNNKQYISQFWLLKLTKQIKFRFCFCLILHYKAFLTVLVNIYNFFVWHGDLQMYNYMVNKKNIGIGMHGTSSITNDETRCTCGWCLTSAVSWVDKKLIDWKKNTVLLFM